MQMVIELLVEGFMRSIMQSYASDYCRLYYTDRGDFDELDVGRYTLSLAKLRYPLRETLEEVNKFIKIGHRGDKRFYILAKKNEDGDLTFNIENY